MSNKDPKAEEIAAIRRGKLERARRAEALYTAPEGLDLITPDEQAEELPIEV